MAQGSVLVYHAHKDGYHHVATVDVSGWEWDNMEAEDALEYAYRWTQNIEGSWSLKDWEDNADLNDLVTVVDADQLGGVGYRSTSVNDAMVYMGQAYLVAMTGFQKHEFPVVKKEWFC